MIELTPTASLYPLRVPGGPHVFGRRTVLSILILGATRWQWWKTKKKKENSEPKVETLPVMNKEIRLQQLLEINTSIRTPTQKAKAILVHIYTYIGIEYDEHEVEGYTLEDIQHIAGTELLLPDLKDLYRIIYTDEQITHSTINLITKSIHSLVAGN